MTKRKELPVAVDAMGGDNAPREVVRGALLAALEYGCEVTLVGRRDEIERELSHVEGPESAVRAHVSIVDATDVVAMDEHPATAVRKKKDSSIAVSCRLVASGDAAAAVSAGNSGAMLAAAVFEVKRIEGIARPAIGTVLPTRRGGVFIIDAGANTDCKPEWLAQFALMGSVYARTMMSIKKPRIGLLSNGEEAGKGSQVVQEAYALLDSQRDLGFTGNVEAKQLFDGVADVAVCDGFVGNMVLKTAEGAGEFLFRLIRDEAFSSVGGKLGGLMVKGKLRGLRDRFDYRLTGGALLLGIGGEVVIAHGRSDALAIKNAIRVARDAVHHDVSGVIARELAANAVEPATPTSQGA